MCVLQGISSRLSNGQILCCSPLWLIRSRARSRANRATSHRLLIAHILSRTVRRWRSSRIICLSFYLRCLSKKHKAYMLSPESRKEFFTRKRLRNQELTLRISPTLHGNTNRVRISKNRKSSSRIHLPKHARMSGQKWLRASLASRYQTVVNSLWKIFHSL